MNVIRPIAKVPRSSDDTSQQLVQQLGFLEKSARDFDAGDSAEGKRLAATLRILLHDGGRSRSLLGQLGRLGGSFLSTAIPYEPTNIGTHSGLLMLGAGDRFAAPLEDALWEQWRPFNEWWQEIVFADRRGMRMTREGLVLSIGEQDGGHHIDPGLSPEYDRLSRRNALNWFGPDGLPLPQPELAGTRQIAHEVLRTLDPSYRCAYRQPAEIVIGGVTLHDATDMPPSTRMPRAPGRNDPCPCGLGKKYKKCHGAPRANGR